VLWGGVLTSVAAQGVGTEERGPPQARGPREGPVRVVEDGNLTRGIWTRRRALLGRAGPGRDTQLCLRVVTKFAQTCVARLVRLFGRNG
jgi:hypothetical protein